MPTVEFLPFATDVGSNVIDQAAYNALLARGSGFQAGIAQSQQLNKTWRQGAFMAAVLANVIANATGDDVLDNGDLNAMITLATDAIQALAAVPPARIITSSANTLLLISDYAVGFNRTAAVTATTVTLPDPATLVGKPFRIEDLVGNFQANPITVTPPGGHTIAGLNTYVMNVNRQSSEFRFYGSNIWGVDA